MMKNDLISRSALLELAHNHVGGTVDCNDIARFPYVINVVKVVRCLDCVHSRPLFADSGEPEIMICIHKNMFPMRTSPGFYCAHGAKMLEGVDVSQD